VGPLRYDARALAAEDLMAAPTALRGHDVVAQVVRGDRHAAAPPLVLDGRVVRREHEARRLARRAEALAILDQYGVWPHALRRATNWWWLGVAAAMVVAVLLGDAAGGWLLRAREAWFELPAQPARSVLPEPETMGDAATQAGEALPLPTRPVAVAPPIDYWADELLASRITAALPARVGRVSVAVRNVRTGASAGIDPEASMPPASVYKLGVLLEAFRQVEAGRIALDEPLLLLPQDWSEGAGVLQGRIGQRVSVGEALRLMVGISDNTAALALLRRVGIDTVNAGYLSLGLTHTAVYPDARPDRTTAADTASLLAALVTGRLADPAATQHMLDLLAQDQPSAWIRAGLPPGTPVAHKSGQLPGVRNDAAIVYGAGGPYVLVVLSSTLVDEGTAERAIASLAHEVYAYFAGT
jgi:beta-lactamase class A